MKYVFNVELLRNLSRVLGVTQKAICQCYGGDEGNYVYRSRHGTILMEDLLKICNTYHIPLSKFIVRERDVEKIGTNDVVYSGEWKDIENKFGYFGISYSCHYGISHKESAAKCGISMGNFYNQFVNGEQRWKRALVKDVLKILNNAKVYPGCVFIDDNEPIKMIDDYMQLMVLEKEIGIKEMHFARKMHNDTEKKLAEMQKTIELLKRRLRDVDGAGYGMIAAEDTVV